MNAGGLTAPQATDLARRGQLAWLPPFEIADSTAREIAAHARRGARISEVLALAWSDVRFEDREDATVEYRRQVDRAGVVAPMKTDGSARIVPIPAQLAVILARHKLSSSNSDPDAFVFATATGRPLGQRNVARALRAAQTRARTPGGEPTFPLLHVTHNGRQVKPPRGSIPSRHSFRHTVASRAFLAGESIDEVAFLLGHENGNVTRAVYTQEIQDGRRRALRRSRMLAEYGSAMEAAEPVTPPAENGSTPANVRQIL
jgi:integrase